MKTIKFLLSLALTGALMLTSCNYRYNSGDRLPDETDASVDSTSYAFGMYLGTLMRSSNVGEISISQVEKGIVAALTQDEKALFNEQELMGHIQKYMMDRQAYIATKTLEEGKAYLEKNKTAEGVVETESGLQYKILKEGTGLSPEPQDSIIVKYQGAFVDGKVFESNLEQEEGLTVPLNRMIPGWQEGLTFVKEGGKIQLTIPATLGYGPNPMGPIPGNSVLVFDVELVKVIKVAAPEEKEKK